MSKIGKKAINIPQNVQIVKTDNYINIKGKLGTMSINISDKIKIKIKNKKIYLDIYKKDKKSKIYWGMSRSLLYNMIYGVSNGFSKKLEIVGTGYKAKVINKLLILELGFSHEIIYAIPENINIKCDNNILEITGYDKYLLGQVSSDIKKIRKIDIYKGKGIKNINEKIIIKTGKKK